MSRLKRSVPECSQHGIDPRLIPRALCLEPSQNIGVEAQSYGRFRRYWLQPPANNTAHDMADVGLRMLRR
jgi:hypothetical protein